MKCVSAGRGDRQGRALRNERSEWRNGAERRNPEHSDPKRSEGERPVSCYVCYAHGEYRITKVLLYKRTVCALLLF